MLRRCSERLTVSTAPTTGLLATHTLLLRLKILSYIGFVNDISSVFGTAAPVPLCSSAACNCAWIWLDGVIPLFPYLINIAPPEPVPAHPLNADGFEIMYTLIV